MSAETAQALPEDTRFMTLDWTISGCCENRLINRETHVTGNGSINYGSIVELTFRYGANSS